MSDSWILLVLLAIFIYANEMKQKERLREETALVVALWPEYIRKIDSAFKIFRASLLKAEDAIKMLQDSMKKCDVL